MTTNEKITPGVEREDLNEAPFQGVLEWAKAEHPALQWDKFTPPSEDSEGGMTTLLTFLEENGVDASGLFEEGPAEEAWRPTRVDSERVRTEKELFWAQNKDILDALGRVEHPAVQALLTVWREQATNNPLMQIEGQSLSETALIYRCMRGAIMHSQEAQAAAEARIPAETPKNRRKKEKDAIAQAIAEQILADHGIHKPTDLLV